MTTTVTKPRPRRGKKKLIISLVVLLGLLVAADFVAATAAEHKVSQTAREQFDLSDDPSVTVHGFPFLYQALTGEYGEISVSAAGVPVADMLRELEINANLRNVEAPLSDLLSGNTNSIVIGEAEGQVKIKASDVGRAVGVPDLEITPVSERRVRIPEDEDDQDDAEARENEAEDTTAGLRLDGTLGLAGQETEISVFAILTLQEQQVDVQPRRVEISNDEIDTVIPGPVQEQIFNQFSVNLDPGEMPFAVTPTALTAEDGALVVKGTASDVRFGE
ncbi:DUF2993 family protein [Tamaricihabitans halophyticus]|uniref:DUF2993 family protein n=2 Tax=Tamaricihabitans halophyticus TaxID=1262583 RepID=A0A4R2QW71_9PSEU|nr:DUF2993 family protein [Tamaricihabitans halophyticus]